MDLYEELVNGPGYAVCSIENIQLFKESRDLLVERVNVSKDPEKNIDVVRKTIAKMSKGEINKAMVGLLSLTNLSEMIINSCPNLVETLCGKELFIQRRANTIFNVPGKEQARQWPHYEVMSGVSPFTYVLWAPFHDLEDDGGVYYIDREASLEVMKKEQAEGLVNGPTVLNMMGKLKPPRLKFGQAIVFNPFILHGNVTFNSKFARIACSVRFQSCSKPLLQKNSDYLKYYCLP
jgi:sporadic carbohydrate cluster 2OG-Fe(II) oxygenase